MEQSFKKKIVIIGAGISGMTAGIYALENGYDVTIYEKHNIAGGQCTGWKRKGTFIDGCAHWIVGTNPQSDLYPLWAHVGAFDETSTIYDTQYFAKFDVQGEIVTFYADIKKLEAELMRIAPEDKRRIRSFINGIKAYRYVKIPVKKPLDKMNIFELMILGIKMLPMAVRYLFYKSISIKDFASRFKSKILKEVFQRILSEDYNIHSLFYIMQSLSKKDAGVVEGGSLRLASNILDTYIQKGGKIIYNAEIDHILIEENVAKGICLKNQQKIYSDFVISTADAHHTLYQLLQGKYEDKYYESRFKNSKDNPLILALMPSYKVNVKAQNLPKMMNFKIPEMRIYNTKIDYITVRNYAFDATLNHHATTFSVLMNVKEEVYDYLKTLPRNQYEKLKNDIAKKVQEYICQYYHLTIEDVEILDIATPLTYERYTNAYKGAYMSFLTTRHSKGLMRKGLIKDLKNFVLAGQWIMPPGGLPIALFTGKHAIYRICNMDKKKFLDLDYLYKKTEITNKAQAI